MTDSATAAEVSSAQVRMLYAKAPAGLLITAIVGVTLGMLASIQLPFIQTVFWWVLWFSVLVARTALWYAHRRHPQADEQWLTWQRRYVVGASFAGFAWGFGAVIALHHFGDQFQYFILLATGVISVTSLAYLSSVYAAYLGFVVTLNLPLFVWLLASDSKLNTLLAVLAVLFVLSISKAAAIINQTLANSFRLRFDNQQLAKNLEINNKQLHADILASAVREEELRMRHSHLQQVAEIARLAHWVWDRNTRMYISVSEGYAQLLGISREELLTTYAKYDQQAELMVAADRDRYREIVHEALVSNKGYTVDYRIFDSRGQEKYFIEVGEVLTDQSGQPSKLLGTLQDATELRRIEDQLRESNDRFNVSFASGMVGMAIISNQRIFLDVNQPYCDFVGYERSELVGKSVFKVFFPDDVEIVSDIVDGMTDGTVSTLHYERRYRHRTGQARWALVSLAQLRAGMENERTFIVQIQDITERVYSERERETLLRELELKNVELERFAYTISHDLKGPLLTIRSFAGLLNKDIQSDDPALIESDISRIIQASSQMQTRLNDLLELARVGYRLNRSDDVALHEVVDEAIELLRAHVEVSRAEVIIDPNLPVVSADRSLLVELYQNLIENALKFVDESHTPHLQIGWHNSHQQPILFVCDDGIGIESRYHDKIFDLFETLALKEPASGVGLAIVRRIVEAHGGKVWVKSVGLGQGTCFQFTLPQQQNN